MYQNIYIYIHVKLLALAHPHMVLASKWLTKSHTKKCLEFENNAVSHLTFADWPTCHPGIPYTYN